MFGIQTAAHPKAASRRRPPRTRPNLEALEDRQLLASFNPLPSAADGSPGSLRNAIIQANGNGQDNTINLGAGTYQLTVANTAGQDNVAAQGDLDLTGAGHSITIQGAGAGATIIDGGALDRVFQISSNVTAVFRNLTIRNGHAIELGVVPQPGPTAAAGGGILNLAGATTTLDHVVVDGCTAQGNDGTNGILGSVNQGAGGSGYAALGGGIYNSGTMTLIQSFVRKSLARGGKGGSGVYSAGDATGGDGGSAYGGGIFDNGSLTLVQSAMVNDVAQGGAGGDGGPAVHNAGYDAGAGGWARGGGLYISEFSSQVQVVNSTFALDNVMGGSGGTGGLGGNTGYPLLNPGSPGGTGGNAGLAQGGAIASLARFSLDNSTVALNESFYGFPGQGGPGGAGNPNGMPGNDGHMVGDEGGGIWAPGADPGDALIASFSSLIAGNTSEDSDGPDVKGNFAGTSHTLLGNADGAGGISDGSGGNIVGKDSMVGPLQDNGGPTPTFTLLAGSPAIDAGSNRLNLSADQRGYTSRAVGGAPDIGAFETGASAPVPVGGSLSAPRIVTAQVLFETVNVGRPHKGRVKTRRQFVGFELTLNEALDAARAQDGRNYTVLANTQRGRKTVTKPIGFRVSYKPGSFVVDLLLTGQQKFPKGGRLVVNASTPGGLADPSGDLLVGTRTFNILPRASGLS
jgi:hypothetical protein